MYDAKSLQGKRDAKARKMAGGTDPHQKVDASSWTPSDPLNADIKTGMRPVSRRAFKSGGSANDYVNRNDKDANEERAGIKHVGALKRGGRAHRKYGGDAPDPDRFISNVAKKREARSAAGRSHAPSGDMRFSSQDEGPSSTGSYSPPSERAPSAGARPVSAPAPAARRAAPIRSGPTAGEREADRLMDYWNTKEGVRPGGIVLKRGGTAKKRAKKQDGGPMVDPALVAATQRAGVPADRLGFAPAAPSQGVKKFLGLKRGGHAEGSTKDKAEDKKMAKARGMTMAAWEKSAADKKHDRKHRAAGGQTVTDLTGVRPTGGRTAKAGGGKTKGRTVVNVMISTGKQPDPAAPMGAMPPPMPGAPPPGMAPPGGAPPMMPPGGPMPRKAGGRAMRSYKDMTAGSLSGLGRLQKTAIARNSLG